MKLGRIGFLVLVGVLASATAHADSKAWAAGKKVIPSGPNVVVGISFGSIRSSQLFQKFSPMLLQQAGQSGAEIERIKKDCGIDVLDELDSIVVANEIGSDVGTIVVALKSKTQKDFEACAVKIAKADGKKPTIAKDGAFMKYGGMADHDIYVKWLAKDVLVVSGKADSKDTLAKYTAGGLLTDKAIAGALGKVKTDASVWGVVVKTESIDQLNAKMSSAYASATVAGGNINAEAHLVLDDAKAASAAAAKGSAQLDAIRKLKPDLAKVLGAVKVTSSGPDLVVAGTVAEQDVIALVEQVMGGAGGTP